VAGVTFTGYPQVGPRTHLAAVFFAASGTIRCLLGGFGRFTGFWEWRKMRNSTRQGRNGISISQRVSLLAAAAVGVAALAMPARAALIVTLNGTTTITDNGAGDTDATTGEIIANTNVAGFGVAITVAKSNSPGAAGLGVLEISSLDVRNNNAGNATLTINVSDNNFTTPAGAAGSPMKLESTASGNLTSAALGNNVTFQSFVDPANGQPTALNPTPLLTFTKANAALNSEPFAGTNNANWTRGAGAYALTSMTTVSLAPNAQAQISGTTTASLVPEPTALALLLAAAPLAARRRRR
jgi:hypothetical protein